MGWLLPEAATDFVHLQGHVEQLLASGRTGHEHEIAAGEGERFRQQLGNRGVRGAICGCRGDAYTERTFGVEALDRIAGSSWGDADGESHQRSVPAPQAEPRVSKRPTFAFTPSKFPEE